MRRKGWGRYSQRSRALQAGAGDPRARRDAQAAALDALRGAPPLEVNRQGETALSTDQDLQTRRGRLGLNYKRVVKGLPLAPRLKVANGKLDLKPAGGVSDLASTATLSQTAAKVQELLVSMRKGGLLKPKN